MSTPRRFNWYKVVWGIIAIGIIILATELGKGWV